MAEHLAVRRLAMHGRADDQRGVEPSAVLVAALEIQVCRIAQAARDHGAGMRGARVKPYVHRIRLLAEDAIRRTWMCVSFRKQILGLAFEPHV